ncbi:MAG: hypothetical protein J6B77_05625 [Clostridia bacterium]|nr:hypothetical protein [Clostridia bacterium]
MKKNILLIGVGGTGSRAVDTFFQKFNELGNQTGNNVTGLVFDTDAGDLQKITCAKTVVMADPASVGRICDQIGKARLREWFPCDEEAIRTQEMIRGASQWRKKSYLAFLNLMNKPMARSTFISALEDMVKDPGAICEVYVIASVAGGTGSGSFIPIALYAKRYLRRNLGKDPIVNAMIALPDIYVKSQTDENRVKVYANAYAILRELNAINLVARNYNAGRTAQKKAPIRLRIGHPDDPNVGVLFDASDKRYWTPEAAPFSQVFLLDRIPNLNDSITAHDMVLADSLYTILCTEIGASFDSEFSNHELLRSQNNGSNAIYAGVSTSQVFFPYESILQYIACKKTAESCDTEWLVLHKAVESTIREREAQAKAAHSRYVMKDSEYAEILLSELETMKNNSNETILPIVERCVSEFDEDGKEKDESIGQTFAQLIETFVDSHIPAPTAQQEEITETIETLTGEGNKCTNADIVSAAADFSDLLLTYYKACLDAIKRTKVSTADAVLTLDRRKLEYVDDKEHSLLEKLIKRNGKYLHPVAALIRLCDFRVQLAQKIGTVKVTPWEDLGKYSSSGVGEVPEGLLEIDGDISVAGSAYAKLGEDRYSTITESDNPEGYIKKRTNAKKDLDVLAKDIEHMLTKIQGEAQVQIRAAVYGAIAEALDKLIAKYRNFFARFEKEKEALAEWTTAALRSNATNVNSIVNVGATEEHKKYFLARVSEESGPVTDAELEENDNIVGLGVYTSVYASAAAEFARKNDSNDKGVAAYHSLFSNMLEAYRASIGNSEAFNVVRSYNVIEAIVVSCGEGAPRKTVDEKIHDYLADAQKLAIPSLSLDKSGDNDDDIVKSSDIIVFMMSKNTARYLKRNAEFFGLHLSADQSSEDRVMQACAEEFIRRHSGNPAARIAIVTSMPDNVLYCTGEIMDITPLRIAKFNELGYENTYFTNYCTAIANIKKYNTDMWNPHLGYDFHKRGNLPYMNPAMEDACDEKMVKALLYGFQSGKITYDNGIGEEARKRFYFLCNGQKITDPEGRWIDDKNIARLLSWMRNSDELIEKWSALFDRDIQRQMLALPSMASDNQTEVSKLESALTSCSFMKLLNDILYPDPSENSKKPNISRAAKKKDGEEEAGVAGWTAKHGPTAVEFAYMVKTSEEIGRDCDDAERILKVLYKVFVSLIEYRTTPDSTPERFIGIYRQQLKKFYEAFAAIEVVCAAGDNCETHYTQLVNWLNQSGVFLAIPEDMPMDERGKININMPYNAKNDNAVKAVLECIRKGNK